MHARRILEQPLFAVVMALLAWSGPAAAQEQSVRIRGAIERVDGPVLTIAPRSGSPLQVTLTPDVRIMAVLPGRAGRDRARNLHRHGGPAAARRHVAGTGGDDLSRSDARRRRRASALGPDRGQHR